VTNYELLLVYFFHKRLKNGLKTGSK